MERAFGRQLGQVRVHTGDTAARLATSVGAQAFAVGEHVAFGAGEYRPGTLGGDLLLAHELAHTVQQGTGAGASAGREPGRFDEAPHERVADLAAARAVASVYGLRIAGLPAVSLAPGRAGLRLQSCKGSRTELDPAAFGPIPEYDKFTTPEGTIIDTDESATAPASMVQYPDQLDHVWSKRRERRRPRKGRDRSLEPRVDQCAGGSSPSAKAAPAA